MDRPRRARIAVALAFAIHAAASGTLGPRFPALKARSGLSDGDLGLALTAYAAGLFVGTRLVSPLLRRAGNRTVIRLGTPTLCASLAITGVARGLPSLVAALALFGVLCGLLDVANNAQAVAVERAYGRPIMSGIHGTWSAGLLAAGVLGTALAAADVSLPVHVGVVAAVLALASVPALRGLSEAEAPAPAAVSRPAVRRVILLLGVVAFAALLVEGAAADWSAVYLRDVRGASPGVAAMGFAAFAAGMTAARVVADRVVHRAGPVVVVRVAGMLAAGAFVLALAVDGPGPAVAAFGLVGLAMGPVVPVVFSAAGHSPQGRTVLSWVVTIGYAGAIAGPAVIGAVAEWTGLRAALLIPAAAGLVISAAAHTTAPAPGVDERASALP